MADTYLWKIEEYMAKLMDMKAKGYDYIIASTGIDGMVYSPSQKKNFYRIPMTIAGQAFKTNTTTNVISPTGKSVPQILIFVHKDKVQDINFPPDMTENINSSTRD
jgi:hypothetical protein